MSDQRETLRLIAGTSTSGTLVWEEVLVLRLAPSRFQLLRSPGLVLGLAADDVFESTGDGTFSLVSRGRNLCIQVFCGPRLSELEGVLSLRMGQLGGRLDGKEERLLVYTVPVSAGFPAIERCLAESVGRFPGAEWYFGNVYDPVDGTTPLNWWL